MISFRGAGFCRLAGWHWAELTLPDILRAEAANGRRSHKSVIMIFLPGGPPHQDMYDLKPDAPAEVRGEFNPINTNVPGIQICEHMPRLAAMMDKLVPIRTMVGATGDHYSFQCMTGRSHQRQPQGGWPEFGSIVANVQGGTSRSVPPYVGLSPRMQHRPYNSGKPGFLGPAYTRCKDDVARMRSNECGRSERSPSKTRDQTLHRRVEQQLIGVLAASELARRADLGKTREPARAETSRHRSDPAWRNSNEQDDLMQQFLMARRLVEAGVAWSRSATASGTITARTSHWPRKTCRSWIKASVPLIEDFHQRGLDKDVTVIVWGEFGRTPKINAQAGRDHWPNVSCALLAGGGLRTGQVIGATDRTASEPRNARCASRKFTPRSAIVWTSTPTSRPSAIFPAARNT